MPDERAEYRLAPEAREDLETVWLYSIEQWGLKRANRYIDDVADAFAYLTAYPMDGTACDHIRDGYRRYPVIRHIIYYRITDYGIAVVRVLHDRMLPSRHL
ncbi:MAG: type II toxin-antitoxin system RelE/ParE family toxin [Gammaproteobacteria bacterium]